jgi:hypothetical protein
MGVQLLAGWLSGMLAAWHLLLLFVFIKAPLPACWRALRMLLAGVAAQHRCGKAYKRMQAAASIARVSACDLLGVVFELADDGKNHAKEVAASHPLQWSLLPEIRHVAANCDPQNLAGSVAAQQWLATWCTDVHCKLQTSTAGPSLHDMERTSHLDAYTSDTTHSK